MKLTKIVMCAMAVGAMAFATNQAQAKSTVIDGRLYVPFNIKGTVNYINDDGKMVKETVTTKDVLAKLGYSKAVLAVGPGYLDDIDVYVIYNGVPVNLSEAGYFYFNLSDTVDTETGDFPDTKGTYTESGIITIEFASNEDFMFLDDNGFAFNLNGTYIYKESDSAVVGGLYKVSKKFSSSNLSGLSYTSTLDDIVPTFGSVTGSGSGKDVIY